MKMSDIFPVPLDTELMKVDGEVAVFDCEGDAAFAAVHAVNHHDDLVGLLDSLIEGFEPWGVDSHCKSCRARVTHKDDCDYQLAINLIDKINSL